MSLRPSSSVSRARWTWRRRLSRARPISCRRRRECCRAGVCRRAFRNRRAETGKGNHGPPASGDPTFNRMTPPKIAIIDYGMGNLRSVARAMQTTGADVRIITAPAEMAWADGVVFPGQGAIVDTMAFLKQTGFDAALRDWIAANKPYLGICLGLQALFEVSEEGGGTPCLGIFPGKIVRFRLP